MNTLDFCTRYQLIFFPAFAGSRQFRIAESAVAVQLRFFGTSDPDKKFGGHADIAVTVHHPTVA